MFVQIQNQWWCPCELRISFSFNDPIQLICTSELSPKADGGLCLSPDARAVSKVILPENEPRSRPEQVESNLAIYKIFSKIDIKSAYSELHLDEKSNILQFSNANGKLYRYSRLSMDIEWA